MMRFIALFLAFVTSSNAFWIFGGSGRQEAQGGISEECVNRAYKGDCTFYVCFDQRHPCEYSNYALSYGWRYCDKINNSIDRFTLDAQGWVNKTRVCAMTRMIEFYRETHINCRDVMADMQDHHAECEAEAGACDGDMLMDNKEVLMEIYKFDRKSLVRFLGMVKECGASGAVRFLDWMKEQRTTIMAFVQSLQERFHGLKDEIEQIRASLPEVNLPDIQFPDMSDILPDIRTNWERIPSPDASADQNDEDEGEDHH